MMMSKSAACLIQRAEMITQFLPFLKEGGGGAANVLTCKFTYDVIWRFGATRQPIAASLGGELAAAAPALVFTFVAGCSG